MTVYNAEATINRAIVSTLRAIPQDAELVVHDDGSTDGTARVLDGIVDPRLRRLPLVGNLGYARARRRLIDATDSEVVAIMDADDVTLPWRFRVQLRMLQRADAVVSPVVRFSTAPLRLRPGMPGVIGAHAMSFLLAFGCPLAHPTLLLKRRALDAAGGYREVVAEDYDLYLRVVAGGALLAQGSTYTLAYRLHDAQVSRTQGFDDRMRQDRLFQTAFDEFIESTFGFRRAGEATLLDGDEADALLRLADERLSRSDSWRVRRYARAVGAVPTR
ncbi:glycosyltransferase [Microbacterium profundi]|nr:glycosyltransferase [Microbacterium profundi]